jgi:hypothetical protein
MYIAFGLGWRLGGYFIEYDHDIESTLLNSNFKRTPVLTFKVALANPQIQLTYSKVQGLLPCKRMSRTVVDVPDHVAFSLIIN